MTGLFACMCRLEGMPILSILHVYRAAHRLMPACARSQGHWTALICAAMNGRTDCARLLLQAGADKDATERVRDVHFVLECRFPPAFRF